MNGQDTMPSAGDDMARCPSAEELRMVRAIAWHALMEAACHGVYRASFRGFWIQALGQGPAPAADTFTKVDLCVSFDHAVIERRQLDATDVVIAEPKP